MKSYEMKYKKDYILQNIILSMPINYIEITIIFSTLLKKLIQQMQYILMGMRLNSIMLNFILQNL